MPQVLDLGVNNLTGEVDVLLANMPYLMSFIVDDNQLQGTLPEEFLTVTLRVRSECFLMHVMHISTMRCKLPQKLKAVY